MIKPNESQQMWIAVDAALVHALVDDLAVMGRKQGEIVSAYLADEIVSRFELRWRDDWPIDRR